MTSRVMERGRERSLSIHQTSAERRDLMLTRGVGTTQQLALPAVGHNALAAAGLGRS